MAKRPYDAKVTIMIVGGILALLGLWFSLSAFVD